LTGDGVISITKNLFGFRGGLTTNFAVNDVFSIQPEVLYSMKGNKSESSLNGSSIESCRGCITSMYRYWPALMREAYFLILGPK
jgi:hypothetical protein